MFFWFNQNGKQGAEYPIEKDSKQQNSVLLGSYSTGSLLVVLAYWFF